MSAAPIYINGVAYNYANITVKIDGTPYYAITSITYGDGKETFVGYGLTGGFAPTHTTVGKYATEDSKITFRTDEWKALQDQAAALSGGESYGDERFKYPIIISLDDPDLGNYQVDLIDNFIKASTATYDQSVDALVEEVTFFTRLIKRNGYTLARPDTI